MRRLVFLLRPGWLILAAVVAVFAYLCFTVLAPWQLGKNAGTSERNRLIADSVRDLVRARAHQGLDILRLVGLGLVVGALVLFAGNPDFGVVMVVNLALGMITPPFGVNLFAACTVARVSLDQIIRDLLPFVAVIIGCLMVITYVPDLSLLLRDLVYGR